MLIQSLCSRQTYGQNLHKIKGANEISKFKLKNNFTILKKVLTATLTVHLITEYLPIEIIY